MVKKYIQFQETGKGLSTNDFTTDLKSKLEGIQTGAEVNVQSDWSVTETTSDAYIANKPTVLKADGYASTDEGKIVKVVKKTEAGTDKYLLEAVEGSSAAPAWADVTGKPFAAVGSGLTVKDVSGVQTLVTDFQFKFQVFTTLPAASAEYKGTIALVALGETPAQDKNIYTEYVCISDGAATPTWSWERLGIINSSFSQSATEIKINGTVVNTASSSQIGLLSSTDWSTFNDKQAQIPALSTGAAKEVVTRTATAGSTDKLGFDTTPTQNSANLVDSGVVHTALAGKVDYESDGASSVAFKIGCDASGAYLDY